MIGSSPILFTTTHALLLLGHTGYYVGQLHFYHANLTALGLLFFGALCDGCGVLPGVAASGATLLRHTCGPLYLLFFSATLVPQLFSQLVERGLLKALSDTVSARGS